MSLLIQEPPLQVLPSLAVKLGLNDAIILQQIHYWILRSNFVFDNKKWVYNSLKDWQKQFPFFSEDTIYRALKRLESDGYLHSKMLSSNKFDKTKYYTIDYSKLSIAITAECAYQNTAACGHSSPQFAVISNTENTTETNKTENTADTTKPCSPKKPLAKKFDPKKIDLPECINPSAWGEWLAYRKNRKLTCTEQTMNAQLRNLEHWHNQGHDPNAIIAKSIECGWAGLFEPKKINQVTSQIGGVEENKRIAEKLLSGGGLDKYNIKFKMDENHG